MAFQHGTGVPSIPGDQQGGMQERDVINALWYLRCPGPPGKDLKWTS